MVSEVKDFWKGELSCEVFYGARYKDETLYRYGMG